MRQVLFRIPIDIFGLTPDGVPIFGFGMMLFTAFVATVWLAGRRAEREGIARERIYDLALWVFGCGILGARIVYMIQYNVPLRDWYRIWEGGIVFYGAAVGGWIGYALGRWFTAREHRLSTWQVADIIAPVVCVGLAIGRLGCLLNGCCYGQVCPAGGVEFPMLTSPASELVLGHGYQTWAGFALDDAVRVMGAGSMPVVGAVEPGSGAARAGMQRGDIITAVNGQQVKTSRELSDRLHVVRPRGETRLMVQVSRAGMAIDLPAFVPRSLPLHPTQLYESISMALLFFVLLAFYPYRRHYGQVFVVLMLGYALHRFFNESLRHDTAPVWRTLTLSQVGSLGVFAGGIALELFLRRRSAALPAPAAAPAQQPAGKHPQRI